MAFGLSFGSKSTKGTSNSIISKDETQNQTGTESTTGVKSSVASQTGSSNTSQAGTSTTSGTTNQATNISGTTQQTSTTSNLGTKVASGLEGAVTALLTQILDPTTGDRAMLTRGMDAMGGFDVNQYVNSTLQAAKAQQGSKLPEILGSIFSSVGGTDKTNSMSTLLANRARGDAASNLAGIEAQARATGAQILQGNLAATSAALSPLEALISGISQILKGATSTTTGQVAENQTQGVTGNNISSTATSEQGTQNTAQTSTSAETIANIVASVMSMVGHTSGTQNTTSTGKESGGGFSLSL